MLHLFFSIFIKLIHYNCSDNKKPTLEVKIRELSSNQKPTLENNIQELSSLYDKYCDFMVEQDKNYYVGNVERVKELGVTQLKH